MVESLDDRIFYMLGQATDLYHRLILVVAPSGQGKTAALRDLTERTDAVYINVNLALSRRMLDLTERQRRLEVPRLLEKIIVEAHKDIVLLDNIEILFEVSLKLDPLRLLQHLSRNRTVVAAWNGSIDNEHVTYAAPEHPEYGRYPVDDVVIVRTEVTA